MKRMEAMESQIRAPETPAGGAEELGTRERKGTRVYVMGKRRRKMRYAGTVPRW